MSETSEKPQIYLITPSEFDLSIYSEQLASCLDATPIACVRLALGTRNEDTISRAADALRELTHARDVALVIESHIQFVDRHGLDGVHLTDAARSVRQARKDLGEDAIVGAFCSASSHDGMTAAELTADYVSFGPIGKTVLGDGESAPLDLFQWWSQMIEVPVVAEGALSDADIAALAPHTDFFGLGDEIWSAPDPKSRLLDFVSAMG